MGWTSVAIALIERPYAVAIFETPGLRQHGIVLLLRCAFLHPEVQKRTTKQKNAPRGRRPDRPAGGDCVTPVIESLPYAPNGG